MIACCSLRIDPFEHGSAICCRADHLSQNTQWGQSKSEVSSKFLYRPYQFLIFWMLAWSQKDLGTTLIANILLGYDAIFINWKMITDQKGFDQHCEKQKVGDRIQWITILVLNPTKIDLASVCNI